MIGLISMGFPSARLVTSKRRFAITLFLAKGPISLPSLCVSGLLFLGAFSEGNQVFRGHDLFNSFCRFIHMDMRGSPNFP